MDRNTIDRLRTLDECFYAAQAASFSQSRNARWPGWERVAGHLPDQAARLGTPMRILDVACGNLRFERFLESALSDEPYSVVATDTCDALIESAGFVLRHAGLEPGSRMGSADVGLGAVDGCFVVDASSRGAAAGRASGAVPMRCEYRHIDAIEAALGDAPLSGIEGERFDVAVSFGFMHHIPSQGLRVRFLAKLVESAAPGGIVAVSLWRFATVDHLREKAEATTREGCSALGFVLEEGDYLVGWNDMPNTYRYCHSFTDEEADSLVKAVELEARLIDRFCADGRSGAMNGYLVFRKR